MLKSYHIKRLGQGICLIALVCCSTLTSAQCTADFDFSVNGLQVTFDNQSSGTSLSFFWDFDDGNTSQDSLPVHTYSQNGTYEVCLTISNQTNCSQTFCDTVKICLDCVWPGDANNDGIAGRDDLLAIGIAFDAIGPVRINPTIDFEPQEAILWVNGNNLPAFVFDNGVNYNHADCDGNGIVNRDDVDVVLRNYGQQRNKQFEEALCNDINDPPLYFRIDEDSVQVGSHITVSIMLGTSLLPVDSVYGVAYNLHYDNHLIEKDSVFVSYANSELGVPDSTIHLSKNFHDAGRMETAVSRIDQVEQYAAGQIGEVKFVMEDVLVQKTLVTDYLNLYFSDVRIIGLDQTEIPVCAWKDSVLVYEVIAGDPKTGLDKRENQFTIYPNPSDGGTIILDTGDEQIEGFSILNLLGEVVQEEFLLQFQGKQQIDVSGLSTGVYIIQINTGKQFIHHKIQVIKKST